MQRAARLFVIEKRRAPAGPPRPAEAFAVEASSMDGLRDEVRSAVAKRKLTLRSVSFGPTNIVAYAEEPA